MNLPPEPSRIHLLAAKEAPIIVILQRKRAKLFHIITVHTEKHWVNQGSWFLGMIYAFDCDVSFDGQFMIYLARGAKGNSWTGLCRLPWLKTLAHADCRAETTGGGTFGDYALLMTDARLQQSSFGSEHPFALKPLPKERFGGGACNLYFRLKRDGFRRLGDNWGRSEQFDHTYRIVCTGDDGWGMSPSLYHPELKVRYLGFDGAYQYGFSLDDYPQIVDGALWATWDSGGALWVARPGRIEQFTLDDLKKGTPAFSLDVDAFEPPAKPAPEDD